MKDRKKRVMLSIWFILIAIIFLLTLAYCREEGTQKEGSETKTEKTIKENSKEEEKPSEDSGIIILTGTVVFNDFEGGFYGIVGDDGKNYEPTNLSEEYKKDGLKVSFKAKLHEDWASISMWGTIIEITSIEKLEQ